MFKAKRGFTLIELLIVIVIIGILAGIVVGVVGTSANNKAQDAKSKAAVHEVQNALEQYFLDNNSAYPTADSAVNAAQLKTALVDAKLLGTTANLTGLVYGHTTAPEGYELSFILKNQKDNNTDSIKGITPDKVYFVTAKQQ